MKAYLVDVSLRTRVILPDSFDIEEFWKSGKGAAKIQGAAEAKLIERIRTDLPENITEVEEDYEVPYDPEHDGVQFCETCDHFMERVTDENHNCYCRLHDHPLGNSEWQGCPQHKSRIKQES